MKVTAIFDIGKTNKKFFLFDESYKIVHQEYLQFSEIKDEDGDLCDDLGTIENWIYSKVQQALKSKTYQLKAINFSTYGASFVHIDQHGKPVTPLYNYLKPFPKAILTSFYKKYGSKMALAKATASPPLEMLNSGLQLYYLKYAKPEIFQKIRWSLHFPQYLSFLLTEVPVSEYTSIGCHTMLWNFDKMDYHQWVYDESIDRILPPIVSTNTWINKKINKKEIKIGVGVHDSSSALLPYIKAGKEPFLLISTGTWSITLNPFSQEKLTKKDLHNDCLNFLQITGKPIKAARLFLGNEYKLQVKKINQFFRKKKKYHRSVKLNKGLLRNLEQDKKNKFHFERISLKRGQPKQTNFEQFSSFDEAYHQLMLELVDLQIQSIQLAQGKTPIKKIYLDGGFADNKIYVHLLSKYFEGVKFWRTRSPLGSALGAAIVLKEKKIGEQFLKKHYTLKKI